jgi:hypothetical protein
MISPAGHGGRVRVKELMRNELPQVILYSDKPTLLAYKSIVDKWGLWGMLMH